MLDLTERCKNNHSTFYCPLCDSYGEFPGEDCNHLWERVETGADGNDDLICERCHEWQHEDWDNAEYWAEMERKGDMGR